MANDRLTEPSALDTLNRRDAVMQRLRDHGFGVWRSGIRTVLNIELKSAEKLADVLDVASKTENAGYSRKHLSSEDLKSEDDVTFPRPTGVDSGELGGELRAAAGILRQWDPDSKMAKTLEKRANQIDPP